MFKTKLNLLLLVFILLPAAPAFAELDIQFEVIASDGVTPIPEGSVAFSEFGAKPAIDNNGNIVFNGAGDSFQQGGIYTYINNLLQKVVDLNSLVPNDSGEKFNNFAFSTGGVSNDIENGRVAFTANFGGFAGNPDFKGIYTNVGQANPQTIVEIALDDNQEWSSLGDPWISGNKVALKGQRFTPQSTNAVNSVMLWDGLDSSASFLDPGLGFTLSLGCQVSLSEDASIFMKSQPGNYELFITSNNGVETLVKFGSTLVPGADGAVFKNIGIFPVIDRNGQDAAFVGYYGSSPTYVGVYKRSNNGVLQKVTSTKDKIPGADIPYVEGQDQFKSFDESGLSISNGHVAFLGRGQNFVKGIYTDVGGTLDVILDTDNKSQFVLNGVTETIYTLSMGPKSFAKTTQGYMLVFKAVFISGRRALIRATINEGSTSSPNVAPIARAGADQTLKDNDNSGFETVTLNGSASSDSDGNIVSYVWSENGQQKATGANANINLSVGSHVITLTVTDDDGASHSDSVNITILAADPPPNEAPTASFVKNCSDLSCSFNSTSTDSDGSIASLSWNFGDGTTSTLPNPSKTYNAAGTYTVTLTVTDDDGASDSASVQVTATDPVIPNNPPVANISNACDELSCVFASESTDSDGSIASLSWNFGDGSSKSGNVINHTYASAGTYTVTLTVTDDDGASDSASVQVTATEPPPPVDEPPTVSITSPSDGEIVSGNVTINASASDDNSVVSVRFFINNVEVYTDNFAPFSHTFDSAQYANGSLNLKAIAYDSANQSDLASINVNVDNAPEPPADNEAPVVNITSPSDGAVLSGGTNLSLAASASDNVGVSYVRFYVNGSLICTDSSPSYACSWKMPKAKGKSYRIQATAVDSSGNSSSDVINISSSGSKGGGGNGGGAGSGSDKPCRGKKCQ